MDDRIIDLTTYGDGRTEEKGAFALWGGEGERSRFALPVWRSIFILDGRRGGLVWSDAEGGSVRAFFVLDLEEDPARLDFGELRVETMSGEEPPAVRLTEGVGLVLLRRTEGRVWWLVVTGTDVGASPLGAGDREDLLFLAGECAGLLTRRGLAGEAGDLE